MPDVYQTIAPEALTRPRGVATGARDTHWLEENIPCRTACPAHTDIPGYLSAVYEGKYDEAYRINLRDNVFPAVLGRVCSRPCEDPCRHGWEGLGESVSICFSKRSSSDFKSTDRMILDPLFKPTGKTVAVIGGGPAGLAAARNLALLGHKCTVYEKHERPGGMMNQGIPEFRLPREGLDREIDQIRLQGVEIVCNSPIGPQLPLEKLLHDFDAVIMACGTLKPNLLSLDGNDNGGIEHGLPWLLAANEFHNATIGDKCLVIGGGFTAMDCARTAFRLQSERMAMDKTDVRVCYRRSEHEMLVTPGEVEELSHEHIPMEFMVGPLRYTGQGNQVSGMEFVRNEMGEPDESGRRRPIAVKDSEFMHEADSVLLATGQFPQCDWIDSILYRTLVEDDGWLVDSGGHTTEIDKLFVAGDFSTGAAALIEAIGHAKETVKLVDKFLTGEDRLIEAALIEDGRPTPRSRKMDFIERKPMPTIPTADRDIDAEVEKGFNEDLSKDETSRCYFCHYKYEIDNSRCIKCDQCIQVMPRPECIVRVTSVDTDDEGRVTGYEKADGINYDAEYFINQKDCIRCNACLEVCPTECISVQKVTGCTIAVDSIREGEAYL
jgi:formate dehydrogenase major subunit